MAVVFLEGFDKYGADNSNSAAVGAMLIAGEWTSTPGSTLNLVAPLSATGQALQIAFNGNFALAKTLPANYARLIGGVRISSNLGGAATGGGIGFYDGATQQAAIKINSSGLITLNGGVGLLATSSASVAANSTHYLEWDITFGNSGAYQVWLDGVSVFSGTGDTTATANNFANGLYLVGAVAGSTIKYDDLYLFDNTGSPNNAVLLTSPRIETTFPISDSAVQFTPGPAILGSNAQRTTTVAGPAAGSLVLRRFTSAVAATLNSITVVINVTNAVAQYRGVVYADSGGAAGALLSGGAAQTGVTAAVPKDLPLTTPQSLAAGTPYWLGFMCDTAINTQESDNNASGYRAAATFASGAPGTAPAMAGANPSYLFWGNLSGAGANYSEASQQPPPGAYSYVYDTTVGHEDLYNFAPLVGLPAPSIVHAVALKGYCQRSDSGAKTVSLRTKSGSTDSGGSLTGQAPATTFGWLASYFTTDPNTSAAWTVAGLNAATGGFRVDA